MTRGHIVHDKMKRLLVVKNRRGAMKAILTFAVIGLASIEASAVEHPYIEVLKYISQNPNVRQQAFLEGLNAGQSLETMARNGIVVSHFDCIPELRVECADAINRVAGGYAGEETHIEEWGEWADSMEGSDLASYLSFLMVSANSRNIPLFSQAEYSRAELALSFPPPDMTALLGNFAACEPGAYYRLLVDREASVYVAQDYRMQGLTFPQDIEANLIRRRVKGHDGFVEVSFDLYGTYYNQKTSSLVLYLGMENGISAAKLTFDENRAQILSVFGEAIAKAKEAPEEAEFDVRTPATIPDFEAAIFCDWST